MNPRAEIDNLIAQNPDWRGATLAKLRTTILEVDLRDHRGMEYRGRRTGGPTSGGPSGPRSDQIEEGSAQDSCFVLESYNQAIRLIGLANGAGMEWPTCPACGSVRRGAAAPVAVAAGRGWARARPGSPVCQITTCRGGRSGRPLGQIGGAGSYGAVAVADASRRGLSPERPMVGCSVMAAASLSV